MRHEGVVLVVACICAAPPSRMPAFFNAMSSASPWVLIHVRSATQQHVVHPVHGHPPSNSPPAPLQEFNKKHDDNEAAKVLGELKPSHTSAIARAEATKDKEQGDSDFAYTIAAARRSEQRRLLAYVRMADYKITDTLHTVLLESCREVLQAVRYIPAPPPSLDEGAGLDRASADGGSPAGDHGENASSGIEQGRESNSAIVVRSGPPSRALFTVELLLDDQDGELMYDPAPEDYQERMAEVLQSYLSSLCALSRLYGDEGISEVRGLRLALNTDIVFKMLLCIRGLGFWCGGKPVVWARVPQRHLAATAAGVVLCEGPPPASHWLTLSAVSVLDGVCCTGGDGRQGE